MQPKFKSSPNATVDATTYATGSITPINGAVYTVWVASLISAGTPNTPTATGTNGFAATFTEIANSVQDQIKVTLFRVTAVSAVAGVITFDFAGQTNSAFVAGVEEWADVNSPINVQSVTEQANAATTITFSPALAAFASALNGTYVVLAGAGAFIAVRGDNTQGLMTQIPISPASNGEMAAGSFFSSGEVLAPTLGCNGAGSDLVAIAIEVSNSLSGGTGGGLFVFDEE